jgi:sugar/nucleoside kinase (ribokinase family)
VIAVTLGHEGAQITTSVTGGPHYEKYKIPAFNDHAADRIGAGDAWFGWTAPLVRAGAPIEVIAFVGACAAAVHVSTVGNEAAKANKVHGFMKSLLA